MLRNLMCGLVFALVAVGSAFGEEYKLVHDEYTFIPLIKAGAIVQVDMPLVRPVKRAQPALQAGDLIEVELLVRAWGECEKGLILLTASGFKQDGVKTFANEPGNFQRWVKKLSWQGLGQTLTVEIKNMTIGGCYFYLMPHIYR